MNSADLPDGVGLDAVEIDSVEIDSVEIDSVEIDGLRWNEDGLVAAIACDKDTNEVLMLAWMNRESLRLTVSTGRAWYWSRSRKELWCKGDTSGDIQLVDNVRVDCDGDALLIRVQQKGRGACHTGRRSCFYRSLAQPTPSQPTPSQPTPSQPTPSPQNSQ